MFGLVDNILKVGQNWSMGRCPISNMIFVDLQVTFLHFLPRFSATVFHMKVIPVMLNHPLYHIYGYLYPSPS